MNVEERRENGTDFGNVFLTALVTGHARAREQSSIIIIASSDTADSRTLERNTYHTTVLLAQTSMMKIPPSALTRLTNGFRIVSSVRSRARSSTSNLASTSFTHHLKPDAAILGLNHHSRSFSSRSTVRRRRRTSEPSSETNERASANKPTAVVKNREIFQQSARAFLDRAEVALEPMKAHNEVFKLTRSSNEEGDNLTIGLKPGEGQYIFQVDEEMCTLTLNSPRSGNYTYVLCGYTGGFVGMDDGHACEGLLVRDLIRHCNGLPQF